MLHHLKRVRFKSTVSRVLARALVPHGFSSGVNTNRGVEFRRTLRGYPNEIVFEPLQTGLQKGFRLSLFAPKEPLGRLSVSFGGPYLWQYENEEELLLALDEAIELILNRGLPWLEDYTPGNVPPWEQITAETIGEALRQLGTFERRSPFPDTCVYELRTPSRSYKVFLDLRSPRTVIASISYRDGGPGLKDIGQTQGHFGYSGSQDLHQALSESAEFVGGVLRTWFEAP